MEIPKEAAIKKPKRLTSVVWNHFERVRKADICYAVCVHCNKKLSGSSNSGTTHLRNHLMRCLKRSNYDVSQLLSAKRRKKEGTVAIASISCDEGQRKEEYTKPLSVKVDSEPKRDEIITLGSSRFDNDRSRLDLARMIILHGYPLSMVDHVGFKVFVKNIQPLFDFMPTDSVELSCMEIYGKEKQKINETFSKLQGRINVAVERWSSAENAEYLCLAARYIDGDWRLQKKVLNFITLDSSHTEDMLSEVIVDSLVDWDVHSKLFAVTFDDCSAEDDIILKIREHICEKTSLLGTSQLFDVRSVTHVLSDMAQDAIVELHEVIQKIRGSIRYIKSSQKVQGKFNELAQQVGVNRLKNLVLDWPDRWNSTYLMLEAALEYRGAFSLLQEQDPLYASVLTENDWDLVNTIAGYLKILVEINNVLSSNKNPTANIYFPEICHLHIQLIEWCKSSDDFACAVASKMKTRFDKYWSKCNLALAVAVILDPRFKMKLVEYYYSQIYGSTALDHVKEISDGIKELYDAYSICSTIIDQGSALPGGSLPDTANDSRDRLKGFDKFLTETSQIQSASLDLDKYLEEPVFPRICDFNILNWWKVHTPRYPILSVMVRDVLGTPMSNSSPESAFCTGGRILDQNHSMLNHDVRQALICTRDWLQMESEGLRTNDELNIDIVF
ncbi:zinc finger BED domain-containing protein RICESLEEPER 1-like [Punica granatum]|uniref:Zinc finger BED domain-containing protein RICESLEEPER 1-like n=2 Tax=Punica granatum TaxID=22663 RepID=A0A6P8EC06_PUNGR|nr:zinc finger BED domain-containing protein RICESLEEPER 1-like [Punica granatum]PKI54274.1 hypothetical protein CRG98_025334 [Punica granatum]